MLSRDNANTGHEVMCSSRHVAGVESIVAGRCLRRLILLGYDADSAGTDSTCWKAHYGQSRGY